LLILSINTFLALSLVLYSLFSLNDNSGVFFRQYKAIGTLGEYEAGGVKDIVAFAVFGVVVYAFQLYASTRIYHIRKHLSLMILLITLVIYVFALLVLNSLFSLT
jgi:hypothetical protein